MCLFFVAGLQAAPLREDHFWVGKASEITQEMARYARLAQEKSRDPAVLAHARRIEAQNEAGFERLLQLAETRQVPLASGPSAAQEREFQAISALQGAEFDRAYWKKLQQAAVALNLCRNQALVRSHDPALRQALSDIDLEAAIR